MENILTGGHCLSPYTCKCSIVFKQLDGLNFDGLAGKHQNFALYSMYRLHESSKFRVMQSIDQKWACPCSNISIAKHYLMTSNTVRLILW